VTASSGTRDFRTAIVRPPAASFAEGLTVSGLGPPDLALALRQHARYCEALERCGVEVVSLPPDTLHPDSTFVEDVAVLAPRAAFLTLPGAPSRRGEVAAMIQALASHFPALRTMQEPGTLDGGDVCEAGDHFFIGLSERTNEEGARQLSDFLRGHGFSATTVDIRKTPALLHLKSGIAYLGGNRLALDPELLGRSELDGFEAVPVPLEERYAANCLVVNGRILVAAGYPRFASMLEELGAEIVTLDVSEFRKMDGGLSCLSLRF
jgi:dimethylargininase